jgi:hypothetical protein
VSAAVTKPALLRILDIGQADGDCEARLSP